MSEPRTADRGASERPGSQRITGKLLATEGYVVGIEISSSGIRQSVALADLDGNIVHRTRRVLDDVPDTATALALLETMLAEVTDPQHLAQGRILRAGVAAGGLVDAAHGVVRTLYHARQWDNFPLQDYLA
ncbi:MAG: ROK family protein, partial [Ktedonobacteraceae bacterium]|nr:ROK family protein [Ktedonobacteraceae bacterium]